MHIARTITYVGRREKAFLKSLVQENYRESIASLIEEFGLSCSMIERIERNHKND